MPVAEPSLAHWAPLPAPGADSMITRLRYRTAEASSSLHAAASCIPAPAAREDPFRGELWLMTLRPGELLPAHSAREESLGSSFTQAYGAMYPPRSREPTHL